MKQELLNLIKEKDTEETRLKIMRILRWEEYEELTFKESTEVFEYLKDKFPILKNLFG
jgi:hypothetical protein